MSVLKARAQGGGQQSPFAPAPIGTWSRRSAPTKPAVVFAPHVETAAGMVLPDDYLKAVADAVHEVGSLFVLDCIASGALWVDMKATGVDVLISAPQKGLERLALLRLRDALRARRTAIDTTTSSSFAMDLKKWLSVMETYEERRARHHTTMPTDALAKTRDVMVETRALGFELRAAQIELGHGARAAGAARPSQRGGRRLPGRRRGGELHRRRRPASGRPSSPKACRASGVPLQCDEPG